MPASRSARAMIFAPRSWPSRPGLATTTRILPRDAASTAGRDATRHAATGTVRWSTALCPCSAADRDRRHPLDRRGLHVVGLVGGRARGVPRPPDRVREHAAALLP